MAEIDLRGKRIAVLVENGFEQVELTSPVEALKNAGAEVFIISKHKRVKGWKETDWGDEFQTDILVKDADAFQFDGLLLPGGVLNPDKLRMDPDAVKFAKFFLETGRPVAAICHGPLTLIETGLLKGRVVTSYPSIRTDLKNAGAYWTDDEVIADNGLVTSRTPDDLPAFNAKMIEEFWEGVHRTQRAGQAAGQKPPVKRPANRLNENIDTRNWDEAEAEYLRDPHDDVS